jgi:hypothetical protein
MRCISANLLAPFFTFLISLDMLCPANDFTLYFGRKVCKILKIPGELPILSQGTLERVFTRWDLEFEHRWPPPSRRSLLAQAPIRAVNDLPNFFPQ